MKKFKNKKKMFCRIAANIKETLGVVRKGDQWCSCYKMVMRGKSAAVAENIKSGNLLKDVPYENEIEKIWWLDDGTDPS